MLGKYKYNGTGNNGTFAWVMQRVSGIVIAICGVIVFWQLAFSEGGAHAITSWLLLPLLLFAVWHTFSGFKMITDDYVSCRTFRFVLFIIYWAVGIATIAMGIGMAIM